MKMFRPLWKPVWRFLKKLRLDLYMIHFHHLNPKESKGAYKTDPFMNMFFCGTVDNSQDMELA
jgi:hypothetical protein